MDYMRQLNGFWNWRKTNAVTHVQADLYFTLLSCANTAYWPETLTIPNSTLIGMCQISSTELHKQRLTLIQKGLIGYKKGKKGSSGVYFINPLYGINPAINQAANPGNIYNNKTKKKTNTVSHENFSYDLEELERLVKYGGVL